jgi:hypothetical protein
MLQTKKRKKIVFSLFSYVVYLIESCYSGYKALLYAM